MPLLRFRSIVVSRQTGRRQLYELVRSRFCNRTPKASTKGEIPSRVSSTRGNVSSTRVYVSSTRVYARRFLTRQVGHAGPDHSLAFRAGHPTESAPHALTNLRRSQSSLVRRCPTYRLLIPIVSLKCVCVYDGSVESCAEPPRADYTCECCLSVTIGGITPARDTLAADSSGTKWR